MTTAPSTIGGTAPVRPAESMGRTAVPRSMCKAARIHRHEPGCCRSAPSGWTGTRQSHQRSSTTGGRRCPVMGAPGSVQRDWHGEVPTDPTGKRYATSTRGWQAAIHVPWTPWPSKDWLIAATGRDPVPVQTHGPHRRGAHE